MDAHRVWAALLRQFRGARPNYHVQFNLADASLLRLPFAPCEVYGDDMHSFWCPALGPVFETRVVHYSPPKLPCGLSTEPSRELAFQVARMWPVNAVLTDSRRVDSASPRQLKMCCAGVPSVHARPAARVLVVGVHYGPGDRYVDFIPWASVRSSGKVVCTPIFDARLLSPMLPKALPGDVRVMVSLSGDPVKDSMHPMQISVFGAVSMLLMPVTRYPEV